MISSLKTFNVVSVCVTFLLGGLNIINWDFWTFILNSFILKSCDYSNAADTSCGDIWNITVKLLRRSHLDIMYSVTSVDMNAMYDVVTPTNKVSCVLCDSGKRFFVCAVCVTSSHARVGARRCRRGALVAAVHAMVRCNTTGYVLRLS